MAVLALAGVFDALYLLLYKLGLLGELRCGTGACETVQASRYATFLGLPVALYGVVGYGLLLVVSLWATQPVLAGRRGPDLLLAGLATLGVAFTAYLSGIEFFVIHDVLYAGNPNKPKFSILTDSKNTMARYSVIPNLHAFSFAEYQPYLLA